MTKQNPVVWGKGRIIFALDVSSLDEADELIKLLAPHVGLFKAGLELITAEGPERVIKFIHERKARVFVDVKFHDIPNTVGNASANMAKFGACMFNVHASGGIDMMRAAVKSRYAGKLPVNVLAVTILTSLGEDQNHLTYGDPVKAKVLQLARDAKMAGVQGLICSAQEAKMLKERPELAGLFLVTPGIRPAWSAKNDQKRIVTPKDAVLAGTDYMVIGRAIRTPPEEVGGPVEAVKLIVEEIQSAEKELNINVPSDEEETAEGDEEEETK